MNIESLPVKIYKDSFIVKNTSKLLKESEIDSYIDGSVKDFLEDAYNERKSKIISSKYDEILEKDVNSLIAKYIEKTHIFEGIDVKDSRVNVEEDEEITFDKCLNRYSLIANKTLREIKKSRKNDCIDVLNSIKEKLVNIINNKEKLKDKKEEPDDIDDFDDFDDFDDTEEIENEKDKKNKLEILIDNTCEQLISCARDCISGYSKIKLNKSIDDKSLEDDLSKYMISFKKNNLSRYKDSLSYNIINIFDYILTKCLCKIAWIDDGKYVTMVSSIDRLRGTNLVITSGVKSSTKILLDTDRIIEIHREGSIFTILIDGMLKNGVNYYENENECIEESN